MATTHENKPNAPIAAKQSKQPSVPPMAPRALPRPAAPIPAPGATTGRAPQTGLATAGLKDDVDSEI